MRLKKENACGQKNCYVFDTKEEAKQFVCDRYGAVINTLKMEKKACYTKIENISIEVYKAKQKIEELMSSIDGE